ncbi:MAG: hypothetical protein ACI4R9_05475 [Kiritimatiellia bacterium]
MKSCQAITGMNPLCRSLGEEAIVDVLAGIGRKLDLNITGLRRVVALVTPSLLGGHPGDCRSHSLVCSQSAF